LLDFKARDHFTFAGDTGELPGASHDLEWPSATFHIAGARESSVHAVAFFIGQDATALSGPGHLF
jgi:hypothetical protein